MNEKEYIRERNPRVLQTEKETDGKDFIYTVGRELIRHGCQIDYNFKTIKIPRQTIGLKVWSLVDYMKNKHGFTWMR